MMNLVEAIKCLVRPFITGLFAVAFVYFTAIKIIPVEAFVALAGVPIVWWFKDREAAKMRKALEKAIAEKK